jgi:hypothetical protein
VQDVYHAAALLESQLNGIRNAVSHHGREGIMGEDLSGSAHVLLCRGKQRNKDALCVGTSPSKSINALLQNNMSKPVSNCEDTVQGKRATDASCQSELVS